MTELREKLVLIGNGMAGVRTLEELLKLSPDHYDITVFGAEPHANYNRIMLSPLLAGEKTLAEIMLNDEHWYMERGITLHKGKEVVSIDRRQRRVVAADGTTAEYDRLLLATGSDPFILPVPGRELPGVITFRDIRDVDTMILAARNYRHAIVIGGGLLGLEAASGLLRRGMKVTVIHLSDTLMERQLDDKAGRLLMQSLQARGMELVMGATTEEIIGNKRVTGLRLKDGRELTADLVVMAVGIRPNIALAKKARIHCERGIIINDTTQTYDPRIYAVGECAQHRNQTFGLVAPLYEMGKVCANHLACLGHSRYAAPVTATRLKVTGIDLFSAGNFNGGADSEEIIVQDPARGLYKKLVLTNNRISGAVMYGDTGDAAWYFRLMGEGQDISALREQLIFGEAHAQAELVASDNAAAEQEKAWREASLYQ